MPRGSKSKYTEKQKRMAEHIEEGYEKKGLPETEAEHRAWATVNKLTGGGMKGGSGSKATAARRRPVARKNAKKAGAKGGRKRAATARKTSTGSRKATRAGSKATSRTGTAGRRASTRRTSGASKSRSTASKRGGSRGGSRKSTRSRSSTRK
jgi:hypothetical protein